jgi:hypothetical protein
MKTLAIAGKVCYNIMVIRTDELWLLVPMRNGVI